MTIILIIIYVALILLPKNLPALIIGDAVFGWSIGDIILLTTFGYVIFPKILLRRKLKLQGGINSLDKIIMLYCVSLLMPLAVAILRFPESAINSIGAYVKYLEPFMIYYLIRGDKHLESQAKLLLLAFITTLIGVLIIAAIQMMDPEMYEAYWGIVALRSIPLEKFIGYIYWRLSGPFFNPNSMGMFLLLNIPMLWALLAIERNGFRKLCFFFLVALSIVALLLTESRSSYIAFLFVGFSYVILSGFKVQKIKKLYIPIGILLLVLGYFYGPLIYSRLIEYPFTGTGHQFGSLYLQTSGAIRVDIWNASLFALVKYWPIGIGFDQSSIALFEALDKHSFILGPDFTGPHNTYLRVFIEGGIIIFVIFLIMLRRIWSLTKVKLFEPWRSYKNALSAGFLGLCIAGIFGDSFQTSQIMLTFMFLLGIVINGNMSYQRKNRSYHIYPETFVRKDNVGIGG